mmetsp:Transcript_9224/g.26362  ORF Transcript_9224/g.26362 Transcript_9224/m.26362 type:complete len:182 (-) Transcript_9224:3604-4149(-)
MNALPTSPSRHRVPSSINKRRKSRLSSTWRRLTKTHSRLLKKTKTATITLTTKTTAAAAAKARKTKGRKVKGWTKANVQPPKNYYGGIGLARKSLYLSFDDAAFFPLLEDEFTEHIPGFYGKQKTKAMKRQLGSNMLWRKMQKLKEDDPGKQDRKSQGINKRLAKLSPDERVEEMIRLGML